MRIGTWNLDYARGTRNPDRMAILIARQADIWVLTETHRDIDLSKTHVAVHSQPRPINGNKKVNIGSTWVTIWSKFPLVRRIAVPDSKRMVAAVFDAQAGPFVIAGVVLPWGSDRGDVPTQPPPRNWAEHQRVLRHDLPNLIKTLRKKSGGSPCVMAGDFNSNLALPYPFKYPAPRLQLRQALVDLLRAGSLICHTANTVHPPPYPPPSLARTLIDHICTNIGPAKSVETWSGLDGKRPRLSDHPGVVVTLAD